jgi:type IVB pilus formation outer membrane protein, R64 PilN family
MSIRKIICGLVASSVAAGCSLEKRVMDQNMAVTQQAETALSVAATPIEAANTSSIKVRDGIFVGSKSIRNEHGDPLPAKFERPGGVTLVRTKPASLREIAAALTETTKIPVIVSAVSNADSTIGRAPQTGGNDAGASAPRYHNPDNPQGIPLDQAFQAAIGAIAPGSGAPTGGGAGGITGPSGPTAENMSINYSGKLSGLLDMLAAHFNVAWRYERGKIVLSSVVTRSFDVPALPIIANLTFDLTSKAETNGETSTSTAGQSAQTKSAIDVWKEIQEALKALVGNGTMSVDTTTGVVTVTADPGTVARVGAYIKSMNERLSKQVAITVKVYSLVLGDEENFDLNVAGIFRNSKNGFNIGNSVASSGTVPTFTGAGGGVGWAVLDLASRWSGSNALVEALSSRGDVTVLTSASVTTLNGVPVPLQVGQLRDYVKRVKVTVNDNTTETDIEPGSVTTGFNLHLVPRVDRNGDLSLQYGINLSELTGDNDGFDTFTSGGNTIQLRRINQRNFIQQAKIPNGYTLVLAGFEQVRSQSQKSGVGHHNIPFLGGKRSSKMEREIVVIAITPTLLDISKKH